jgi:hypothetical protein
VRSDPGGGQTKKLELVTIDPVGGLGNTLFTVAAGYAFARQRDAEFAIRRVEVVPGHCSEISPHFPDGWPVYWDTVYRKFRVETFPDLAEFEIVEHEDPQGYVDLDDLVSDDAPRICISGYFQNSRYFDFMKQEISDLVKEPPDEIREYLDERYALSASSKLLVIGVRQSGDYAENGWRLPLDYYLNAYRFFKRLMPVADYRVVVIADEVEWARKNLAPHIEDLLVVDERHNPLGHDMSVLQFYLMMRGTAFILSNSTFHWWGAYLADTELILSPRNHRNPFRVTMPTTDRYFEISEAVS